ncbi:MAG: magnesium transporter [Promethearchaeota archaeon]
MVEQETFYQARKILRESSPILLIVSFFSLISGSILENSSNVLEVVPILLVAVPGFMSLGGDLGGIFSARLTSAMHLGESIFWKAITSYLGILILSTLGFGLIGIISVVIEMILGYNNGLVLFCAILTAGLLTVTLTCCSGIITAYITFQRGLDPDNFTAPISTTIGDVSGIVLLTFIVQWLVI